MGISITETKLFARWDPKTNLSVDYGGVSRFDQDKCFEAMYRWCSDQIGWDPERWDAFAGDDSDTNLFVFREPSDALAFKMRFHGADAKNP